MAAFTRRTRAGFPLGVLVALFVAVFASRLNRRAAPEPAPASAPTAAPSRGAGGASPAATSPTVAATAGGPGFTNRQHLVEHYEKHGGEFPGLSMPAYLAAAQTLRDASAGGDILELRRRDGVVTRFDRASGAFLATNRDRTIRTFFKPNDGEQYFRRQATRSPGGGP